MFERELADKMAEVTGKEKIKNIGWNKMLGEARKEFRKILERYIDNGLEVKYPGMVYSRMLAGRMLVIMAGLLEEEKKTGNRGKEGLLEELNGKVEDAACRMLLREIDYRRLLEEGTEFIAWYAGRTPKHGWKGTVAATMVILVEEQLNNCEKGIPFQFTARAMRVSRDIIADNVEQVRKERIIYTGKMNKHE